MNVLIVAIACHLYTDQSFAIVVCFFELKTALRATPTNIFIIAIARVLCACHRYAGKYFAIVIRSVKVEKWYALHLTRMISCMAAQTQLAVSFPLSRWTVCCPYFAATPTGKQCYASFFVSFRPSNAFGSLAPIWTLLMRSQQLVRHLQKRSCKLPPLFHRDSKCKFKGNPKCVCSLRV